MIIPNMYSYVMQSMVLAETSEDIQATNADAGCPRFEGELSL